MMNNSQISCTYKLMDNYKLSIIKLYNIIPLNLGFHKYTFFNNPFFIVYNINFFDNCHSVPSCGTIVPHSFNIFLKYYFPPKPNNR